MDGEGAHAVERRGFPIDGAGGRSGGTPGELVLADLVGGQRGGPRGAAEEGGEMGGPAAGGADGSELPDLIVLEVGGAEVPQGRPLGAERARGIERSSWSRRSAGAAGRRCQGTIVRAGWRTRSSATRPSSAMAFAPGVQPGRGVRSSSAMRS